MLFSVGNLCIHSHLVGSRSGDLGVKFFVVLKSVISKMSFKYKELFFLFLVIEAINGLALDNPSTGKSPKDISIPLDVTTNKFQNTSADKGTTESVTVLIPNSSNILSKSTESPDNAIHANATSNMMTKTTSPPTSQPVSQLHKPGQWIIRNNGSICIIAEMTMQLNITYPGKTQTIQNTTIDVPGNSTLNGTCSNSSQSLNITWGPGYSLLINFGINETAKNYFISGISLNVNATVLKDVTGNVTLYQFTNQSREFVTPLDMSYKCNKIQKVNLEGKESNTSAVLFLKNTQYEAYMNKSKAEFAAAQDCDAFDTPDIVPIAVGCALAILVLVVLVAYLIARKRPHSQGYLSM